MQFKSFGDLSNDIKSNLYKIDRADIDLVVGIPRSGMIPAYTLGLLLNKPVSDIIGLINNSEVSVGITRPNNISIKNTHDAKSILLVDDSIISGKSFEHAISKIPKELHCKITTLVIYSDEKKKAGIDIIFNVLRPPRVFEWNIYHRELVSNSCFDIDGVLCIDPTPEENDDGEKYKNFLINAKPLFIPTTKIDSIVTSRLEKYRHETVAWLSKHNVLYDNLIMLNMNSADERRKAGAHAEHKAKYYKNNSSLLFIESEPSQAKTIMELSGKPVYCTMNNFMYVPGLVNVVKNNPASTFSMIKALLPSAFKNYIRKFLNKS